MFTTLLTALIYALAEGKDIPKSFDGYQLTLEDAETVLRFIESPKNTKISDSKFFEHFTKFLTSEVAACTDYLNSHFYLAAADERAEAVKKIAKADTPVSHAVRKLLTYNNYQSLASEINKVAKRATNAPYILVQSPREMDSELKKEIRKSLSEKYQNSFPTFQINKKLIGGLRVFQDGKTQDHSWLSRVHRFTSLTSV